MERYAPSLELKAGAVVSAEEILAHCRKHMAGVKILDPARGSVWRVAQDLDWQDTKVEMRKQAGSAAAIDV